MFPSHDRYSNPFRELYFHYDLGKKNYLSPVTHGKPDPVVEFCEKLKASGNSDEWKLGKKMEPKMRTYVPILVRGAESEGVKFWGFGKQVYQELLGFITDPDYGDISDPMGGRDIVVEFTPSEGPGQFPKTTIRVKPKKQLKRVIPKRKIVRTLRVTGSGTGHSAPVSAPEPWTPRGMLT